MMKWTKLWAYLHLDKIWGTPLLFVDSSCYPVFACNFFNPSIPTLGKVPLHPLQH